MSCEANMKSLFLFLHLFTSRLLRKSFINNAQLGLGCLSKRLLIVKSNPIDKKMVYQQWLFHHFFLAVSISKFNSDQNTCVYSLYSSQYEEATQQLIFMIVSDRR